MPENMLGSMGVGAVKNVESGQAYKINRIERSNSIEIPHKILVLGYKIHIKRL